MDWRADWKPFAAAVIGVVLLWIAFVLDGRVPLLSLFDLGIHELGHLITRPFGIVVSFVMGSGLQMLVPLGLSAYFWFRQRDRVSAGLLLCWGATSMQDVSVYVADAPYRSIQLIGGTHDWWWLLSRWGHLEWANELAKAVWLAGLVVGSAGLLIILLPPIQALWATLGRGPAIRVGGPARVRRPRPPI